MFSWSCFYTWPVSGAKSGHFCVYNFYFKWPKVGGQLKVTPVIVEHLIPKPPPWPQWRLVVTPSLLPPFCTLQCVHMSLADNLNVIIVLLFFDEFQEMYEKILNLEKHQDRLRAKGLFSKDVKQMWVEKEVCFCFLLLDLTDLKLCVNLILIKSCRVGMIKKIESSSIFKDFTNCWAISWKPSKAVLFIFCSLCWLENLSSSLCVADKNIFYSIFSLKL